MNSGLELWDRMLAKINQGWPLEGTIVISLFWHSLTKEKLRLRPTRALVSNNVWSNSLAEQHILVSTYCLLNSGPPRGPLKTWTIIWSSNRSLSLTHCTICRAIFQKHFLSHVSDKHEYSKPRSETRNSCAILKECDTKHLRTSSELMLHIRCRICYLSSVYFIILHCEDAFLSLKASPHWPYCSRVDNVRAGR